MFKLILSLQTASRFCGCKTKILAAKYAFLRLKKKELQMCSLFLSFFFWGGGGGNKSFAAAALELWQTVNDHSATQNLRVQNLWMP